MYLEESDPYLQSSVEVLSDENITIPDDMNGEAMGRGLKEMFTAYAAKCGKISKEAIAEILEIKDLKKLMAEISAIVPFYYTEQQELLEETDFWKRYELLAFKLVNEVEILNIKEEIQEKSQRACGQTPERIHFTENS